MNKDIPYITIDDKNNITYLEEQRPGLIIEGKSDYDIYSRVLLRSDISKIDIVLGESKSNILKKHDDDDFNFEYIIILDADYDRINNCCRKHDKIIYTHFYTMENYLTLKEVVKETIGDFQNLSTKDITEAKILDEAYEAIKPFVIMCNMKNFFSWEVKLEDYKIYRWWDEKNHKIDENRIKEHVISELKKNGEEVEVEDFEHIYRENSKEIDSYSQIKRETITHGKRKIEVLHCLFKKYFPMAFQNRNEANFKYDLLKNIFESPVIEELVRNIELKVKQIVEGVQDNKGETGRGGSVRDGFVAS